MKHREDQNLVLKIPVDSTCFFLPERGDEFLYLSIIEIEKK